MPLISRRTAISAGLAAGTSVLFPSDLFGASQEKPVLPPQPPQPSPDDAAQQANDGPYSPDVRARILDLAKKSLTGLFAGQSIRDLQSEAEKLNLPPAQRLNVTLRHSGRIRSSMSASGTNLGRQVLETVFRAALDWRYGGPLSRWEVPDVVIEIWIQTGAIEIERDARSEKNPLLLGVEGVEIEGLGRFAYYKPSVAITSSYKTDTSLLEALCKKAGLPKDSWQRADVALRRTQWLCLTSVTNAKVFSLPANTSSSIPLALNKCIEESAKYLIRNQDITGLTAYLYDPIADQFLTAKPNLVRSAGCLLALSQVLQSDHPLASDPQFKSCTVQMARGLLDLTSLTADGNRFVREQELGEGEEETSTSGGTRQDEESAAETPKSENQAQIPGVGATALLAAALGSLILQKEFATEYQQLYRSIVSAQKPDGRFVTHFGETEENERTANYYSGEALLVLALEAERGNKDALQMCLRAFEPYVKQFRSSPTSAFVGWHVNIWSRIAILTGEHAYAAFAFEQIDWLLPMQITSNRDVRWVGGFSQSGATPQFSTVVFLEAVARALNLAIQIGDTDRIEKYRASLQSGLHFCKLLMLEETQSTLLANPARCKGGIAFGLIDRRVRCDAVQHFITLCLAVEQVKSHLA
jgi:hypothetical protein